VKRVLRVPVNAWLINERPGTDAACTECQNTSA
jgi:hypothetical protein